MNRQEELIHRYFQSWIDRDDSCWDEIFDKDVVYSECYGPEYHGLGQMRSWFRDWNKHGRVLLWDIKGFLHQGLRIAVEWRFSNVYDDGESCCDGVSLIDFDSKGRIVSVKEFESKAEHFSPEFEE